MFETPFYINSHSSHGGDSFGSGCKNFCEFHNLNRDNIAFQNDVQSIPTRQNNAKYDVNAILRKAGYVIIGNENGDRSRSRNPAHKTNFPPNHHSKNPFFSQSIYDPSRYFNSPITDETSQILSTCRCFSYYLYHSQLISVNFQTYSIDRL